ncbi:hypothetical protein AB833_22180 [Chromatiales bacterium (ex Bugula neritina AB1)]|nr:hypothetical protein AB833_22180 [Chromatiales bacterium (ex Bugula neritina AB1)]
MLDGLLAGAAHLLVIKNLLLLFLGTALGIVFGAIPGLTATMGLALLVPFTFSMDPTTGLLMLAGIYVGAMYGDAIPAILINTPGTPAAIATTFDGYPLSQKGMAQHALVAAAFASCFGSLLANVVLAVAAEPLAEWSLAFGPPEYFWLGVFGLTIVSVLSADNLLKGFVTAAIGLLLSTVGIAALSGDVRLTFGFPDLQGGIGLAGALIGFFCLPEILSNVIGKRRNTYAGEQVQPSIKIIRETIFDLVRRPVLMTRSAIIGLVVGVAPGAGGNIASMVSYSEATRWEKDNHEFGKGTTRGVAASEAANSAMAPGSMIPLLTLGIPGSPPAAVILGALMLHGMQPGNDLFAIYSDTTYAFIVGLAVAAVAVLILGTLGSFIYARIINIPSTAMAPAILVMTALGSYAIRNNMLDVWMMLIFGVVGFILNRLRYHPAPLVLGFILGPYIEDGLVQSKMIGGASGNVLAYMTLRPICLVLIALCIISALWPLVAGVLARNKNKADTQNVLSGGAVAGDTTPTDVLPDDTRSFNADLWVGCAALAIAAITFTNTLDLSEYGRVFVQYTSIVLALLGVVTVYRGIANKENQALFASGTERNRVLLGIALLIIYLAVVPLTGFLIATVLFYFVLHTVLHDYRLASVEAAKALGYSLAVPGFLYVLFAKILHVPLP